jgi:hypothetical protein
MNTYRNSNFTKRNYDCTNIVACRTEHNPSERGDKTNIAWTPAVDEVINGLTMLWICDGVEYYGYL